MSSVATVSSEAQQVEQVVAGRIWWVGLLAIVISVGVNSLVRIIALIVFDISPRFSPLANPGPVITLTVIGVFGAVIVFAIISKFSRRPVRLFRIIAAVVLLISFLPDLRMLALPGIKTQAVLTLMLMHVIAAVVSVWMLTTMTREQ